MFNRRFAVRCRFAMFMCVVDLDPARQPIYDSHYRTVDMRLAVQVIRRRSIATSDFIVPGLKWQNRLD